MKRNVMSKSEINAQIEALLQQEGGVTPAVEPEFEKLSVAMAELRKTSEDEQLQQFINDGGDSVEFVYHPDEDDKQFNDLSATLTQRLDKQKEEKNQNYQETIAAKQKLVERLKGIAKTDVKNLGKNFQIANEIQAEWKAQPHGHDEQSVQLENEYKHLLDTFYYDAKIVKEAIELDYQKNLAAKQRVVEKIKALAGEDDVRVLEQKIRQYEKEWYRVGPVKRDLREESKKELEDAVAGLQGKLDELYENEQGLLEENLAKKITICENLNEILGKEYSSPKQFQQAADKVIALQHDWREVGRSSENDRIWEVFRGACDSFFEQKREFFKGLSDRRKENKAEKQALIKKAESAQQSTDWKKTANFLIGLQKDWKKIGPAHPAEDQKLWEKFRGACDVFFDARKEHFKEQDKAFAANLEHKRSLIEEVKAFVSTGNVGKDMNELQKFEKAYQAIGYVPFKVKDKIHKQFYDALNGHYNALNIDRQAKDKMRFENRVKSMATGKKPDRTLDFERNKVQQELSELKTKLAQYQNNVNIVSSGKDNPLVKMIQQNIKETEREIERKEMQLRLIKDAKSGKLDLSEEE